MRSNNHPFQRHPHTYAYVRLEKIVQGSFDEIPTSIGVFQRISAQPPDQEPGWVKAWLCVNTGDVFAYNVEPPLKFGFRRGGTLRQQFPPPPDCPLLIG
jgi:hypothetical protein